MKDMFDRMRGRVLGINIVDLLVLIIVVFAVLSYVSKPDESIYGGNQMYSAIQDFQRLDSRGFFVKAEINGTYLWDNTPFKESGLLQAAGSGLKQLMERYMLSAGSAPISKTWLLQASRWSLWTTI